MEKKIKLDLKKQIQEGHFSKKAKTRLSFTENVNNKIRKCNKSIRIIKKLSISFPRNALIRI